MNMNIDIKDLLNDKLKVAYAASAAVLLFIAYTLIIGGDLKSLGSLNRSLSVIRGNQYILRDTVQYKRYIGEFENKYLFKKGENAGIQVISETARKTSVTLDLVQPSDVGTILGRYRAVSFIVEGSGSYQAVTDFVAAIENNENYFAIESFNLSPNETSYEAPRPSAANMQAPETPVKMPEAIKLQGAGAGMTNKANMRKLPVGRGIPVPGGAQNVGNSNKMPRGASEPLLGPASVAAKKTPSHKGLWAGFSLRLICITSEV